MGKRAEGGSICGSGMRGRGRTDVPRGEVGDFACGGKVYRRGLRRLEGWEKRVPKMAERSEEAYGEEGRGNHGGLEYAPQAMGRQRGYLDAGWQGGGVKRVATGWLVGTGEP